MVDDEDEDAAVVDLCLRGLSDAWVFEGRSVEVGFWPLSDEVGIGEEQRPIPQTGAQRRVKKTLGKKAKTKKQKIPENSK